MATVTKRRWTYNDVTKEGWAVRYVDPATGKRPSKQFDTKKLADAFKRKVEREIEDGMHVTATATRTVRDAAAAFLAMESDRVRDGEIGRSHYVILDRACRLHIVPQLGNVLLTELQTEQVTKVFRAMRGAGIKHTSARKYLTVLLSLERFARKRGWMRAQPAADAMLDVRSPGMERIATFLPPEIAVLLPASRQHRPRKQDRASDALSVAVHLAALMGMRIGEILGLPVDAIDLGRRRIEVRQGLSAFNEIKGPKTAAGNRFLPLTQRVAEVLSHWMEQHYRENEHGLLLTSSSGGILKREHVGAQWHALLDHCGLPRRHFHALRHFHASWLIQHGMPAPEVAKLLGHSQFDMTLRVYTHALMDDEGRADRAEQIAAKLMLPDAREPQLVATY